MNLLLTDDDRDFQREVREFLAEKLTDELRLEGARCSGIYCEYDVANAWHRILADKGWSVPNWPMEYGGCDWSPLQNYIFEVELAQAGAPPVSPNSTHMVGPVIIAFGTDEQKAKYLPAIRSGDDWWAQGYSEPGAGSDLASLKCAASRQGDEYVVNGSKIWTTHAHFSNRIFCLVRTRTEGKPQAGISFLLIDLDTPGISIRPIISISGEHELNEVFFSDVRVPVSSRIGEENDGWTVAKYLLQHERSHTWSPLLRARLDRLKHRAQHACAEKFSRCEIDLTALEMSEMRALQANSESGPLSTATSSTMKVLGTELRQKISELALEIDGHPPVSTLEPDLLSALGLTDSQVATRTYLNDRAASIYAGANEVQRNIIWNSIR
ncbi:acyl-CoA dehydrogenase family protein [Henriciella sp. AS95]|uniref:acyl-CoA dehydrogenase family protein n=1 Tax=Henriciella sp. AS95 TaxID=3135782 RepID=UPI00317FD1B5